MAVRVLPGQLALVRADVDHDDDRAAGHPGLAGAIPLGRACSRVHCCLLSDPVDRVNPDFGVVGLTGCEVIDLNGCGNPWCHGVVVLGLTPLDEATGMAVLARTPERAAPGQCDDLMRAVRTLVGRVDEDGALHRLAVLGSRAAALSVSPSALPMLTASSAQSPVNGMVPASPYISAKLLLGVMAIASTRVPRSRSS